MLPKILKIVKGKKTLLAIAFSLVAIITCCQMKASSDLPQFTFDQLQRGDLLNSISCTGTLEPVGSVDVGTELSGTVSQVLADYNDDVTKGQILAILDTTMLSINLQGALATQIKAETDFKLNKLQYLTDKKLYQQKVISELELLTSEKSFKTAQAALVTAQTDVEKFRLNIDKYSIIRSPIDGKVISRSIEAGQTVAASLSAPTLFSIAENLAHMEIYASVDEGDIGQVKKGMEATFSVEAYPEESFTGTVKQIRLQPETVSNVVNYTVIVDAENEKGLLLPGMTATLEFVIEEKKDIFYLNGYTLDFAPQPNLGKEHMGKQGGKNGPPPRAEKGEGGQRQNQELAEHPEATQHAKDSLQRVWYLDEDENLNFLRVQKGMVCGTKVEIYGNDQLTEGMKIVCKQKSSSTAAKSQGSSSRRQRPLF